MRKRAANEGSFRATNKLSGSASRVDVDFPTQLISCQIIKLREAVTWHICITATPDKKRFGQALIPIAIGMGGMQRCAMGVDLEAAGMLPSSDTISFLTHFLP